MGLVVWIGFNWITIDSIAGLCEHDKHIWASTEAGHCFGHCYYVVRSDNFSSELRN
jgi:hypothetical protein